MVGEITIESGQSKTVALKSDAWMNGLTFWVRNVDSMTTGWTVELYYGPLLVTSSSFGAGNNLFKYHDQAHFPPYRTYINNVNFEVEFAIKITNNDAVSRKFRYAIV